MKVKKALRKARKMAEKMRVNGFDDFKPVALSTDEFEFNHKGYFPIIVRNRVTISRRKMYGGGVAYTAQASLPGHVPVMTVNGDMMEAYWELEEKLCQLTDDFETMFRAVNAGCIEET